MQSVLITILVRFPHRRLTVIRCANLIVLSYYHQFTYIYGARLSRKQVFRILWCVCKIVSHKKGRRYFDRRVSIKSHLSRAPFFSLFVLLQIGPGLHMHYLRYNTNSLHIYRLYRNEHYLEFSSGRGQLYRIYEHVRLAHGISLACTPEDCIITTFPLWRLNLNS